MVKASPLPITPGGKFFNFFSDTTMKAINGMMATVCVAVGLCQLPAAQEPPRDASPVPQRTSYSGLNDGDPEVTYRNRTFSAYLSRAAFQRITKTGAYSAFENATGIYFRAGDTADIEVSGTEGRPVTLIVHEFEGDPIHSEYPLREGSNSITIQKSGLAYIDYRVDTREELATAPKVQVKIRGGQINGIMTPADSDAVWEKLLRGAKCGMMELVGERVHLLFDGEGLRKGCPSRGKELLALYDEVMRMEQDDILGWNLDGTHAGNHIMGRSVWSGYMHADGIGAAFTYRVTPLITDPDDLPKTSWSVAHEFGHVNQTKPAMCWSGLTEVTNNIFSVWCAYNLNPSTLRLEHGEMNNALNVRMRGGCYDNYINAALVKRRTWFWYGYPNTTQDGDLVEKSMAVQETLIPLWQLQLYLAVARGKKDFYPRMFHTARVTDDSERTNGEIEVLFMKRACDAAQLDLSEFFVKLGMLAPMDRISNDYISEYITITQEMCLDAIRYASRYPRPDSSVIFYISGNSVDIFKNRAAVVPSSASFKISEGLVEIPATEWQNAVAFEAYCGDKLLHVSLRGLNHEDNQSTSVICPDGTDRVMAVQWDGQRFPVQVIFK